MGRTRTLARTLLGVGAGLAGAYGAYAVAAWYRYGRTARNHDAEGHGALLDAFIPEYEVAERHNIRVDAPAAITLAAACDLDLMRSPVIRGLFAARALAMRARPETPPPPPGLLAQLNAMGWVMLAETAGHEMVFGTVTRPWEPNVVFRPIPAAQFAAFGEPYYVKIAFTVRADPLDPERTMLFTETRVATTDVRARRLFRRYWAAVSAGIVMIRLIMLRLTKTDAERRARKP